MLIALFLIPLVVYLIAYRFLPKYPQSLPLFGAIGVAFISLLTLTFTISQTSLWTNGKRIVWTGVKSNTSEITIGGNNETAVTGWANNSFAPKVSAKVIDEQIELEISGGDGFVKNDSTGQFLNGEIISDAEQKTLENYVFTKNESWFFWKADTLNISKDGTLTLTVDLPSPKSPRVYNLDRLIEKAAQDLTPTDEAKYGWFDSIFSWFSANDPAQAKARFETVETLKIWAQSVRLMKSEPSRFYEFWKDSEVRLLPIESATPPQKCELPCQFSVLWANSKVVAEFAKVKENNQLVLQYLPPMRNFSPMPPEEAKDKLIVTDEALPDDFVYTLPLGKSEKLGSEQEKGRATLDLKELQKPADRNLPDILEKTNDKACQSLPEKVSAEVNCLSIRGEKLNFIFSLLEDIPSRFWIFALSILSLITFAVGLLLANAYLPTENRWAIYGLCAAIWNFLMLRLLLAVRYAIDPAYLDSHSIGDVTFALTGLGLMPGFLLLIARLRNDENRNLDADTIKKHKLLSLGYTLILFGVFLINFYFSRNFIWKNLPDSFLISYTGMWILLGLFLLYLILQINYFYNSKKDENGNMQSNNPFAKFLNFIFIDVWNGPQRLAIVAQEGWESFVSSPKILDADNKFWQLFRLIILFFLIALLGGWILGIADLIFTQVLLPIYLCGIPIILLLAAKAVDPGADYECPSGFYLKLLPISAVLIIPFFVGVFIIGDAGSIYAYLAAFIPLIFILLKRCNSRRFAIFPAVIIGILIFGFLFVIYDKFFDSFKLLPESVAPRILAFREGRDFQNHLLASDAGSGHNDIGLDVTDITNTYQHLWENEAIAQEGGWLGFGFGEAPVRLSQVRQDTIQYDSVFSFFIVGDYGLIGGILLLLLYFVPLILIFIAGRKHFDVGYALAMVIAGAFLIEGLTHAAMNLWVVPLTGRSIPLLAVHSFKGDLLRWLIFFAFAVSAMFWRHDKNGKLSKKAATIFSDGKADFAPAANQEKEVSKAARFSQDVKNFFFKPKEMWRQILLIFIFPAIYFVFIVCAGIIIWFDSSIRVFNWNFVKENTNGAIDVGVIRVEQDKDKNEECPKLVLNEENYRLKWTKKNSETSFLAQQINRFNALECKERLGQGVFSDFQDKLKTVTDFEGYQKILDEMRQNDAPARPPRKPFLLAVERVSEDNIENQAPPFAVSFNPAFNVYRSFQVEEAKNQVPEISFAGGEKLLGAAWVKGKWVTASNTNPSLLSWTDWMGDALTSEWKRLKNEKVEQNYKELSLDPKLHMSTLSFVDRKGIELHKQNISGKSKLPPRVGLTVLRLSSKANNGAALALGSFPRTTSGKKWKTLCYKDKESKEDKKNCIWLPPAQTVEKRFPYSLRQLYGGDRNFENSVVMGSSTKPIWAAAVLAVHPTLNLEQDFRVSASGGSDNLIFGINTGEKGWTVHQSSAQWVDFNRFLAESNNRYQVLFSFLGLAKSDKNEILTEQNSLNSSNLVTMKNQLWNKTPVFADNINFSPKNPRTITNLDDTDLARKLRSLYGINTYHREEREQKTDYSLYMNSFWTKNESDDLPQKVGDLPSKKGVQHSFPPVILPARVNLKLNRLCPPPQKLDSPPQLNWNCQPRDFVSLLLGGGENRWSNVQIAAAFGASVTGKPILPHIINNEIIPTFNNREEFVSIAEKLRPGLREVVFGKNGTARPYFSAKSLEILSSLDKAGYKVFAKTGTLEVEGTSGNTSRLLLAIVKFEDGDPKKIKSGLVFSIFAQQTSQGTATKWLGEFIIENEADIRRLLG
jgi:cell division protein FtsI/penicillin-binding protein 2